jgi:heme oxygenase
MDRTATQSLLADLRQATRGLHASVESALAVLETTWTPATYRNLLLRFHGFHRPLDERLTARLVDGSLGTVRFQPRAELLEEDLAKLGGAGLPPGANPRCDVLPPLATPEEAMGCLYVLEGSALGGRVILPWVIRCLGPESGCRHRFFNPYGSLTGARWGEFCAALEAFSKRTDRPNRVVDGAMGTFDALLAWFEGWRP